MGFFIFPGQLTVFSGREGSRNVEPDPKPGSQRTHQYGTLASRAGMGSTVTPTSASQIKCPGGAQVPKGPHRPGDVRGISGFR